jgi:UDP-glucose 4-epimerase
MERIENGEPPLILGDGSQTMDFIYITDVARANLAAATTPHTNTTYNIASGTETSLLELAQLLLEVMDTELPIEYGPERAVNKVPRRLADTKHAQTRLDFQAQTDLRDGLHQLVRWWRDQQAQPAALATAP